MEFQRIFYADGSHDEIPTGPLVDDGTSLIFMVGTNEVIRVARGDVLAIEGR
jgi:hypothetical protein